MLKHITGKSIYNNFEEGLITAAADMIILNRLSISNASEKLSTFFPNRTTKAIELRLGSLVREKKKNGGVTLLSVENVQIPEVEKKETNPFSLLMNSLLDEPAKKKEIVEEVKQPVLQKTIQKQLEDTSKSVKTTPFVSEKSLTEDANPVYSSPEEYYDGEITTFHRPPFFNVNQIGSHIIVRVNNVLSYGFFADNYENRGLVFIGDTAKEFINADELSNLVSVGDILEVIVCEDSRSSEKVVLKPAFFDVNGHLIVNDKSFFDKSSFKPSKNIEIVDKVSKIKRDLLLRGETLEPGVQYQESFLDSVPEQKVSNNSLKDAFERMELPMNEDKDETSEVLNTVSEVLTSLEDEKEEPINIVSSNDENQVFDGYKHVFSIPSNEEDNFQPVVSFVEVFLVNTFGNNYEISLDGNTVTVEIPKGVEVTSSDIEELEESIENSFSFYELV